MSMTFEEAIAQLKGLRSYFKQFEDLGSPCDVFTKDIEAIDTIIQKAQTWIPCRERMPDNADKPGAFCEKYLVLSNYGLTEGWFNPDYDCWFVLLWYYTSRFLPHEINLERADVPRVCRLSKSQVTHWMPFPDTPGNTKEG